MQNIFQKRKARAASLARYRSDPEYRASVKSAARMWQQENRLRYLLLSAKHRARQQGLEFTISELDLLIPAVCPVLGIPLIEPSIDRKDNSKGYIPGNVFIISKRANTLKSNGTLEEFERIVDYLRGQ